MRRLLPVVLLAGMVGAADAQTAANPEETPAEFVAVRRLIESAINEKETPSVAVAVVRDDKVVWAQGFGLADLESGKPATPNSIYRLASISKPVTATALMLLVERGLLDLDAPANKYLPKAKLTARRGDPKQITIRRIANHTSGLPLHYTFFYPGDRPYSYEEAIRRHGFAATVPGEQYQYSNLGYGLLGYITEVVAETPWDEFLRQQIFDRLGMTRTDAGFRPEHASDATRQYTQDSAGRWIRVDEYDFDHPGASAVCSSALDLARFARLHLNGGVVDDVRLLAPEAIAAMHAANVPPGAHSGYGIGWAVSKFHGRHCVSHSGGMPGVSTMLRMYPNERVATIVLLNCDNRGVTERVTQALAEALFGKLPPENEENAKPKSDGDKPAPIVYTGRWRGTFAHFDGDIPIELEVSSADKATLQLGSERARSLRIFAGQGPIFVAQTNVRLRTIPGYHGLATLELRLRREGDSLAGVGVSLAEGYFALSNWMELARVGDLPTVAESVPTFDVLIKNARIVDGTGVPWYRGDVAVRDDRIVAVGKIEDASAKVVIDAEGQVVAPGFIDMMGQTATPFLENPAAGKNLLSQGITTINCGEGHSAAPVDDVTAKRLGWRTMREYFARLDAAGMPLNIVQTVGHTQIRRLVLGDVDRRPTPAELERMQQYVEEAMQAGAIGLSTALIYPPAVYATTDEIAALAQTAGRHGGKYFTHMRNEGDLLLEAIDEALRIGQNADCPVHIFHLKTAGRQNWPKMEQAIAMIKASRAAGRQVAADIYPYVNNGLSLTSFIHPKHSAQGGGELRNRLKDLETRKEIRREMEELGGWENWYRHIGNDWNNVVLAGMKEAPYANFNGQSLAKIAKELGRDEWDVFFDICLAGAFALPQSMSEANKILAMQQEFISFDTDVGPDGGSRTATHPRAYGAFPRVLAKYVRELGVLSLEQAVQRMSAVAANELMLHDRGRLAPGLAADIVIFNPDRIQDRATLAEPAIPSVGVKYVLVNGKLVWEDEVYTGARPGRVLRGPGYRPESP